MKKFLKAFNSPNIGAGYLYFYVHFVVEVVCFYCITQMIGNSVFLWIAPFVYDSVAFVPQGIIGYFSDKYPKINMGIIGTVFLLIGLVTMSLNLLPGSYTELILVCLGNAFIHVEGAEVTLRSSKGKMAHSAIFVAGGSFGVITGKLLKQVFCPYWIILLLGLTMIPFILLADYYKKENNDDCKNFNYQNKIINPSLLIILTVFIVFSRSYMGYGIPTAWNKTIFQTVLLFCVMGVGKALGGVFLDTFGIRKTAIVSILCSLPFLLFGDHLMLVSLIGILMFSMTMPVTLAILVSVLKKKPGIAFGLTTIGLFLGFTPIFFYKITSTLYNCILISFLTLISLIIALMVIKKEVT